METGRGGSCWPRPLFVQEWDKLFVAGKERKGMLERLDKFLASQNVDSRKGAARLVRAGAVTVNGATAFDCSMKVDPENDRVAVNAKEVAYRQYLYIMMNKPAGVLSASSDSRAATVLDLLPPEFSRKGLFPAGRLDKDTTGLLLITNDGGFAHRMLTPKSQVFKLYMALLEKPVTPSDIDAFRMGVSQGGQSFAPARLWTEEREGKETAFVEIREGKFHQVKRMFQAVGNRVISLKRLKIGGLSLDDTLQAGASRLLTEEEKESIFH